MQANKTQPNSQPVQAYLAGIKNDSRREDARKLLMLMQAATATRPVMWGSSIIGFGTYHYVYDSGREGDTPAVGFAARAQALVIYGLFHYEENKQNIALAGQLGVHTAGKGCLYIKKLSDINLGVLEKMIINSFRSRANA